MTQTINTETLNNHLKLRLLESGLWATEDTIPIRYTPGRLTSDIPDRLYWFGRYAGLIPLMSTLLAPAKIITGLWLLTRGLSLRREQGFFDPCPRLNWDPAHTISAFSADSKRLIAGSRLVRQGLVELIPIIGNIFSFFFCNDTEPVLKIDNQAIPINEIYNEAENWACHEVIKAYRNQPSYMWNRESIDRKKFLIDQFLKENNKTIEDIEEYQFPHLKKLNGRLNPYLYRKLLVTRSEISWLSRIYALDDPLND